MSEEYKCAECGLHYENQETAKECEAFCKEHNACSLEITKHAAENKGMQKN